MPQSFSRYCTVPSPISALLRPRRSSARCASSDGSPLNSPELDQRPGAGVGLGHRLGGQRLAFRLNHDGDRAGRTFARTRSRAGRAPGTPMTAPVPYSTSTKLATQIGTGCLRERIDRGPAGVEAFLLDLAGHPRRAVLRLEPLQRCRRKLVGRPPPRAQLLHQRVLGRQQHEVRAVDRVDARGEDLDVPLRTRAPAVRLPTGARNLTRAPSDRPIQFRCIVRTFSGQLGQLARPSSSSSA